MASHRTRKWHMRHHSCFVLGTDHPDLQAGVVPVGPDQELLVWERFDHWSKCTPTHHTSGSLSKSLRDAGRANLMLTANALCVRFSIGLEPPTGPFGRPLQDDAVGGVVIKTPLDAVGRDGAASSSFRFLRRTNISTIHPSLRPLPSQLHFFPCGVTWI
ncbi:hypothetical protein P152DRAFT_285418 [Eremomyces bilateralis CBS 781.70]|uniref:Uncharacterized protein n=1 Tax=Eremomyces bilateralis CBS 781.70 TaxID=1392243 RepID=A0A6G1G651_9PEZI|nr:uncharacterized protein P152DRAFT_285418 [Eremomyces bilateralis CBS 781.70]KAF1813575.1 hypothetical protein P152DRAFT_285418 [Eremomyces bilateralis CBS 781.70]